MIPKTYLKNVYCVSCACHARIVKVRSVEERRVRNNKKKPKKEIQESKLDNPLVPKAQLVEGV
jgi:small subunit ribosomal protein S26e